MHNVASNKSKIAKRVIEVLDFFDHDHPTATVMDIVRRYGRPQSSTSELLSTLVEMGLLHKDRASRSYSPTPRAALLGAMVQPEIVRNGSLNCLIDELATKTKLSVGVFGMVGLQTQIICWHNGEPPVKSTANRSIYCGMQERLTNSAVGRLLLSTQDRRTREGMLRRLNAESDADQQFAFADMVEIVEQAGQSKEISGRVGFGSTADVSAVLIPDMTLNQPLAIGIVHEPSSAIDKGELIELLRNSVVSCVEKNRPVDASVMEFTSAA